VESGLFKIALSIECVIGLGNPGKRYSDTRHNIGWMVLDEVARRQGMSFKPGKGEFFLCEATRRFPAVLLKPTTYMNLSGVAVRQILSMKDLSPDEILVVYDDLALPFGQLRLRKAGSSGGHNGIADIIARLGTDEIPRIRMGIGEKPPEWDGADFVLANFDKREQKELPFFVNCAAFAVETAVREGFEAAMNEFNGRGEPEPKGGSGGLGGG